MKRPYILEKEITPRGWLIRPRRSLIDDGMKETRARVAYTMITSETGYEAGIIRELKEIPGVQEVYQLYGIYDIIIKIEAESMKALKDIISLKVRKVEHIRSSLTLICVD